MISLFDPSEQLQITCDDPGEFRQKVIGWNIEHIQLVPGNYQIDVEMFHTRNIQLSNVIHYVGVQERGCTPPRSCVISLPTPLGKYPLHYCDGILQKDKCPVSISGDEFGTFSKGGINYFTIVVDTDLLNREAGQLIGRPFTSLVQSKLVTIKRPNQLRLIQTISTIMQELKIYPLHLSTVQQELLEKQIMEQLLLSIRPTSGEKIKIPNRRQVAWRAEQLMRQYPQKHLNIEQLCGHIGCSARNLHLGFKERYGMTPVRYGNILALNGVRHKLIRLQPGENISEIAMAWGFYHLGRFSEQYKQLFTELPSVTIKRAG